MSLSVTITIYWQTNSANKFEVIGGFGHFFCVKFRQKYCFSCSVNKGKLEHNSTSVLVENHSLDKFWATTNVVYVLTPQDSNPYFT
jgi:hypothetical protein